MLCVCVCVWVSPNQILLCVCHTPGNRYQLPRRTHMTHQRSTSTACAQSTHTNQTLSKPKHAKPKRNEVGLCVCVCALGFWMIDGAHALVKPTFRRLIGGERRNAVESHRFQDVVHVSGHIGRTALAVLDERVLQQGTVLGPVRFLLDQTVARFV